MTPARIVVLAVALLAMGMPAPLTGVPPARADEPPVEGEEEGDEVAVGERLFLAAEDVGPLVAFLRSLNEDYE